MAYSPKAKKLCTPIRKRFVDIFKPSITLGKRNRNLSSDDVADIPGQPRSSPVARTRLKRSASVALQHEDGDLQETIIVTALETIPFCCHEDLLTMTRPQLFAVAEALNAKLPAALRIDIKPTSTDSFIRNAIELIVGIKRTVPGAPKAVKLGLSSVADPDNSVSPPTSPLATKSRPRDIFQPSPRLAVLKEEDEDMVMAVAERSAKKRKVSAQADIRVTKRRVSAQVAVPIGRTRSAQAGPTTHAPNSALNRARSQRIPTSHISPPQSFRVLRSHSQKLPAEMKNMAIDTTFITMRRPRYRFRPKHALGMENTPTPPKRTFRDGPLLSQKDREDRSPEEADHEAFSSSTSNSTNRRSSPSSASTGSGHATPRRNIVRAKREVDAALGSDVDEDDGEMAFGLRGMTMATSGSDMDESF